MEETQMKSQFHYLLCALAVLPLQAIPFTQGDVFVSLRNGTVREYTPTGTLVQTLNTGYTGELTGSTFDSLGNFYVTTGFANPGNDVRKFDNNGVLQGTFGSGYVGNPESVLVDAAGNFYVGAADSDALKKFDSNGMPLATYSLAREDRGIDWIDLAANQSTMYYTSEGNQVKRFDVATNTQLSDFSSAGTQLFALRLLSSGGLLAANTSNIIRLNAAGAIVQTYLAGAGNFWFGLNLDPDGTSFWTAHYNSGRVVKVDIASGSILQDWSVGQGVSGLSVFGEITDSQPPPGIPEPATSLLIGAGILALVALRRRNG
jgi:hypothetical protein